ncbi:hypothetical protein KIPB_006099 [Kipferlia bialata]|uniref:Uncharacterized protein n=1 Tax=Kipferlia bialata TaxID=797122 RepID=A0A9K3CY09_9EUKA|nr:hypothetical protein KIPB_006099 [Kipferlia bialata]|eukprot:g6099.t1
MDSGERGLGETVPLEPADLSPHETTEGDTGVNIDELLVIPDVSITNDPSDLFAGETKLQQLAPPGYFWSPAGPNLPLFVPHTSPASRDASEQTLKDEIESRPYGGEEGEAPLTKEERRDLTSQDTQRSTATHSRMSKATLSPFLRPGDLGLARLAVTLGKHRKTSEGAATGVPLSLLGTR